MYIQSPDVNNPRFHKIFRKRFRMPYEEFKSLVVMTQESPLFERWQEGNVDAFDRPASPLPLLILCALRYIGRGWTFDDLSENTGISEEIIRVFFHRFIDFGSTILYKKFVISPSNASEASWHTHEYAQAGLPGCVGSSDATHIVLEKVEYRLRQSHLGFKSSHTARSYNVTVNHRRQILATTTGHPARWNDKTVVLFDNFIVSLNEGTNLQDVVFELYDSIDTNGNVVKQKYSGAWVIVDNGYLNWSTTVPPMKSSCSRPEIRFSHWLESIRKDVECTFGILKSRFRILKTGIRLHKQEAADKIFLTCCAIHNWLLDVDGLDKQWEDGVPSDWEGQLGCHDLTDTVQYIPDPLRRIMSRNELAQYDLSGMGYYGNRTHHQLEPQEQNNNTERQQREVAAQQNHINRTTKVVKDLSLAYFRSKLIKHFDIAFHRQEIQWPGRRNRQQQVHF
jgi:hypothetical protein